VPHNALLERFDVNRNVWKLRQLSR
jgi:hypothetical protein